MRERLRRLFDLVDPMPEVVAAPLDGGHERLEPLPDETRGTVLSFGLGELVVHLEVGPVLSGMVVPPVPEVEVRWPQGLTWAPVDEHGLFEVDDVPRGPVRLKVGNAVTDWFVR